MTIPSIAIVGAGASGTLLALQLRRKLAVPAAITLIDRDARFGLGLAYSTENPNHLVNIPIGRMSAFEDQPLHFVDWMQRKAAHMLNGAPAPELVFVPRHVYGAYLRDLLGALTPVPEMLHDEVVAIEVSDGLSRLRCASGRVLSANLVVLATGNDRPATPDIPGLKEAPFWRPDSWRVDAFAELDRSLAVLLIGTGPTAVDAVITLLDRGHVGSIYAVSRRGLLPRPHAVGGAVLPIQLPPHPGLVELTRFVRQEADASRENWRGVIDALSRSSKIFGSPCHLQSGSNSCVISARGGMFIASACRRRSPGALTPRSLVVNCTSLPRVSRPAKRAPCGCASAAVATRGWR